MANDVLDAFHDILCRLRCTPCDYSSLVSMTQFCNTPVKVLNLFTSQPGSHSLENGQSEKCTYLAPSNTFLAFHFSVVDYKYLWCSFLWN